MVTAEDEILRLANLEKLRVDDVTTDLLEYKTKSGNIFNSARHIWQISYATDPVLWWQGNCSSRALMKVAVILLTMCATSAATERSNKGFGLQKTKLRNRLSDEHAADLTYVAYNLKMKQRAGQQKRGASKSQLIYHKNEQVVIIQEANFDDAKSDSENENSSDEEQCDMDIGDLPDEDLSIPVPSGTFVAAKIFEPVKSRPSLRHKVFIGKIAESLDNDEYLVSFLRMNKFGIYVFPEVGDTSIVDSKEIRRLKEPAHTRRGGYVFTAEDIEEVVSKLTACL